MDKAKTAIEVPVITLRDAAWILYGIRMPDNPPQHAAQHADSTAMHNGWRLGDVYDAEDERRKEGTR